MRLSTKARAAVEAALYLASHHDRGPCNANDICRDQNISVSYLEQLFAALRQHGLVVGVRGPGGGYRLAKPPEEISVADVITAVDDHAYVPPADNVVALYRPNPHSRYHDMWRDLSTRLYEFLSGITLAECLARNPAQDGGGRDDSGASKAVG